MTTERITFERLVELVDGDHDLIVVMVEQGVIERSPEGFCAEDVDRALASRTLVRELEVNWPGVDIILRLRKELADARQQLAQLQESKTD